MSFRELAIEELMLVSGGGEGGGDGGSCGGGEGASDSGSGGTSGTDGGYGGAGPTCDANDPLGVGYSTADQNAGYQDAGISFGCAAAITAGAIGGALSSKDAGFGGMALGGFLGALGGGCFG